jgi:hypothetical protein
MRDGSGNEYSIVFSAAGGSEDPAVCEEDGTPRATACFWRGASDATWSTGNVAIPAGGLEDADGAGRLRWLCAMMGESARPVRHRQI